MKLLLPCLQVLLFCGLLTFAKHCQQGRRMSPIDLNSTFSVDDPLMNNVKFKWNSTLPTLAAAFFVNFGTEFYMNFLNVKAYTIIDTASYLFETIYIFWPSSHSIDGIFSDAELELVFAHSKFTPSSKAFERKNGLVIVSVLLKQEDKLVEDVPALRALMEGISQVVDPDTDYMEDLPEDFTLQDLLPESSLHYFRYIGSLMNEANSTCNRRVVFRKPFNVTRKFINGLKTLRDENGPIVKNSHELQPLNGRKVYRSFKAC